MRPLLLLAIAAALALASCGASPAPRVTPEMVTAARADDASVDQPALERGRQVYVSSCATCHALPRPASYDAPSWRRWMRSMAPKARLDDGQASAALRYVLAVRVAQSSQPSPDAPR